MDRHLTSAAVAVRQTSILEREAELDLIGSALESTREGTGALLTVEGPAGSGKSVLLDLATDQAERGGFTVLSATGREIERGFAFGLVTQLFAPLVAELDEGRRSEVFSGAAGLAQELLEGARHPEHVNDRFPILHGLHWLCANLTAQAPVLLVADDAHWADEPSLELLAYLAPRVGEMPLCLAVGIREGETASGGSLSGLLGAEGATALRPGVLGTLAVSQLLRDELGLESNDELAERCRDATAGNPLFVRELIQELTAEEIQHPERLSGRAFASVSRIVLTRVGRLEDDDAAVLRAMAILGEDSDPLLIPRLASVEVELVLEALERLERQGLIVSSPRLGFTHPVVRQAMYDSISPARRSQQHLRAARALGSSASECERAAAHLMAAERTVEDLRDDDVEILRRAATIARERGGGERAAELLTRAVDCGVGPDRRRELLLELGEDLLRTGDAGCVARLREAVKLSRLPGQRALAALALSNAQLQTGDFDGASTSCGQGLAALEDAGGEPATAELRLALEAQRANAIWIAGKMSGQDRSRIRALEDEALAGDTPAKRAVLTILAAEATVTATRGSAKVIDLADRAIGREQLLEEMGAEHPSFIFAVSAKTLAESFEEAIGDWTRGVEHSRRRGSIGGYASALACRGYAKQMVGDLRGAEADALEAIEAMPDTRMIAAPLALATAANVAADRAGGDTGLIERQLATQMARDEDPPVGTVNYAASAGGWLALSQGRLELARDRFLETARRVRLNDWPGPAAIPWRSGGALALRGLGEIDPALELVEEEVRLARQWGAPGALGVALRSKALVLRGDTSIDLLEEAVATLERSGARLEHAKSLVELGAAIRRGGSKQAARGHLREGMDLAHRCGASSVVERALSELRASGARPHRPAIHGSQALSPRELQTARLAVEGRSNREIAEAMFLTRRTIEMHLSSAYQKLGISGRDQLEGALGVID